ncbi:MAG: diaminopimelate decarboxylase [Polyangiaceae bacterium]|nr:diaminopimelate decarboxylase [Polyangiaceae bacterium]
MSEQIGGFSRNTDGESLLGGSALKSLLSPQITTPAYFYDLSGIFKRVSQIKAAFGDAPHLIAYAIKANSAASIVKTVIEAGGGVDAVSGGELQLALACGAQSRDVVLSGVAKRDDEIRLALEKDIQALQAESVEELQRIAQIAELTSQVARVSFRINPSVEIDSHAHIATGHDKAKFGISRRDWNAAFAKIKQSPFLQLVGISTHVGSMLKTPASYLRSAKVVCEVAQHAQAEGHQLEYVDFGGGFGIDYGDGPADPPHHFAAEALGILKTEGLGHLKLVVEPGRSIVGPYGALVAQVIQTKVSGARRWAMIDAGMNDLLRPALYGAPHRIEPLSQQPQGEESFRVVGPVCESTDDFGDHDLCEDPDYVVIRDAGAYAFTMASEYNARPLPDEVFIRDGKIVHHSPSPGIDSWLAARLKA